MGTNGCTIIVPRTRVEPKPRFFRLTISGSGLGVVVCKATGTGSAIGAKKRMPLSSLLAPKVKASNLAFSSASATAAAAFLVYVEFDQVFYLFIINR